MSIRIMSLVWDIDLPDSQKIVLLALADNANDEGVAWPSLATLCRKCSKSERTVQGVIKRLVDDGHLSREERPGKSTYYRIHPRSDCTPAESAPPQRLRVTPAEVAGDPRSGCGRTIIEPSGTVRENTKRACELPDDWLPDPFTLGSQCRTIIDGWPPGEWEAQVEHFTSHHRAKGTRMKDWQSAWSTWVLNSRKFNNGSKPPRNARRDADESTFELGQRVARAAEEARAAPSADVADAGWHNGSGGAVVCLPGAGAPGRYVERRG